MESKLNIKKLIINIVKLKGKIIKLKFLIKNTFNSNIIAMQIEVI